MVTTRALSKLAASGDADAQFRLGYRFAFCKDKRRQEPETGVQHVEGRGRTGACARQVLSGYVL